MMRKLMLTLALTGILGSAVVNAASIEKGKNVFKTEKAKKHKKKKYANKVVKKNKKNARKY
jgi:hypothetical protein